MTNQYKKALDDLNQPKMTLVEGLTKNYDTIHRALRIADALMGEPSPTMLEVIGETEVDLYGDYKTEMVSILKAMRDQLLKDV